MAGPSPDTARGAFTEEGPWVLDLDDPAAVPWLAGLDRVRDAVRRSVPELTRPRRLPPGERLLTTARHLGAAVGLWALRERRLDRPERIGALSRRLRVAAERLGPTYIKLAQIVSSGEGIFPPELVGEMKRCRDRVAPEPWPVVERVLVEDLGRPVGEVFASIEREPLASASIAQVHRARLRAGHLPGAGEVDVVVKVQRPQVRDRVHQDLRVMAWLAPILVGRIPVAALANPPALVELFAETITEELDFRLEAQNMVDVARAFADLDQRGYVVPRPHPRLVTRRVLVMERLDGFRFEDVAGMRAAGVDTEAVLRTGMIGGMEGAMIEGIFHGDLHGGNLLVRPDGRTALLDFGIVGRLTEEKRLALLSLLVHASSNHLLGQLAALRDLGALPPDADLEALVEELGLDRPPVDPTTMTGEELVREIQRTLNALLAHGARMPKELMLFVKNLVFLDGAIATLAPDLDIFAEVAAISTYFAEKHGERIMAQLGLAPDPDWQPDLTGLKASFGLDAGVESLTHREVLARRRRVRENLEQQGRERRERPRRSGGLAGLGRGRLRRRGRPQ